MHAQRVSQADFEAWYAKALRAKAISQKHLHDKYDNDPGSSSYALGFKAKRFDPDAFDGWYAKATQQFREKHQDKDEREATSMPAPQLHPVPVFDPNRFEDWYDQACRRSQHGLQ